MMGGCFKDGRALRTTYEPCGRITDLACYLLSVAKAYQELTRADLPIWERGVDTKPKKA